ncbi:MAG: GDSL-type esterase/lipase family protein [Victivallaceae bacterium]
MNIKHIFTFSFLTAFLNSGMNAGQLKNILIDDFRNLYGWKVMTAPGGMEKCAGPGMKNPGMKVKMPGIIGKNYGIFWFKGSEKLDMDGYQGIAFNLKGDGSDNFGYITVADRYGYSYTYSFPLKNTGWHPVYASWSDFVPQGEFAPVNFNRTALVPSALVNFRFGTSWNISHNNRRISAHEFCIDDLRFEKDIAANPDKNRNFFPFKTVLSKLRNKEPVRVLCMGDSITVGIGLRNRGKNRYAKILENLLREKFGYSQIYVESRAVGGADLVWARTWCLRDFYQQRPDLVTVHFGYNDKSRKFSAKFFTGSLNDYLDKISAVTNGKTAVLLFATIPGIGPRYNMLDDYSDAVKSLAQNRNINCLDLHTVFKKMGKFVIRSYFADMAHPNERGHELMAQKIFSFIISRENLL